MTTNYIEAKPFNKIAARVIDMALILLIAWQYYAYTVTQNIPFPIIPSLEPVILIFAGLVIYRLICLFLFNKTLGMQVTGIVLLNAEEEEINPKEKLLAAFFVLYKGVDYYQK